MKKVIYYLKDKKAMIYKKKEIAPPGRMPITWYIPIASSSLWCYTSQLSQSRIYEAMGVGRDENRFFVFNHIDGIELEDAILYKDRWYRITRIDTEDDYNTDIYIYVDDMSTQPSAEEIVDHETGKAYL